MRRLGTGLLFASTLWSGLGAAPALATSPVGKSYGVVVFDGETPFPFADCYTFEPSGTLRTLGFGDLLYRFDQLDKQRDAFQAGPTQQTQGFAIFVHGTVAGGGETIRGNVVASDGATFIFQGQLNPRCGDGGARAAGQAYRR